MVRSSWSHQRCFIWCWNHWRHYHSKGQPCQAHPFWRAFSEFHARADSTDPLKFTYYERLLWRCYSSYVNLAMDDIWQESIKKHDKVHTIQILVNCINCDAVNCISCDAYADSFNCGDCDKSFRPEKHLRDHTRMHAGESSSTVMIVINLSVLKST